MRPGSGSRPTRTCSRSPDFTPGAREQRDHGARDPGRDRAAARRRVPAQRAHSAAGSSSARCSSCRPPSPWVVIGFVATRFFADDGILQIAAQPRGPRIAASRHALARASALFAVMITFIWSMFGTNLIVFLAGMATIDPTLYDAARVDGASSFAVLIEDHGAAAAPLRAVQLHRHARHGVHGAVLADLRDDGRRSRLRDDDARVLHLPGGVLHGRLRHRPRPPARSCSWSSRSSASCSCACSGEVTTRERALREPRGSRTPCSPCSP